MSLRVLSITPSYSPSRGGMETYVSSLNAELASQGCEVVVLTGVDGSKGDRLTNPEVHRLSPGNDGSYVEWERGIFGLLDEIRRTLRGREFDIIHTQSQVSLFLAHLSGLAEETPIVASFHETDPTSDPLGAERTNFILKQCPANRYLTGSKYFNQQLIELGIPAKHVTTVLMGVASGMTEVTQAQIADFKKRNGLPSEKLLISLIGRYTSRKNHLALLQAFEQMEQRSRAHLVLLGATTSTTEKYLRELKIQFSERASVDSTLMVDVDNETRDQLLAASAIVVQPSKAEGLGLAVVEAMMAGKPVLVSEADGFGDLIGDFEGLAISDDGELARKLDELICDRALRIDWGQRLSQFATENLSIERAAKETLDCYHSVLGGDRGK